MSDRSHRTADGAVLLLLGAILLGVLLLASCSDPAAPAPRKIHTGPCTIVRRFFMDRADTTKGVIVIRERILDTNNCPDEIRLEWDDDRGGSR